MKKYKNVKCDSGVTRCFSTAEVRSRNMSKIRSKNTVPELMLRRMLWAKNVRYRLHPKQIPGCPDIVIIKYRLAIFVDGDFWHGYNWKIKKANIKTNRTYWYPKIERNIEHDKYINKSLVENGYVVMRFWEHEIKKSLTLCVNQVLLYIEAAKNGHIPERN